MKLSLLASLLFSYFIQVFGFNTTTTNSTIIVSNNPQIPPLITFLKNLPYPLNIYIEYGGVIIPWVICVIITGILTLICCCCGYRRRKNQKTKIIVQPAKNRRDFELEDV
jgi:hypothetical protein